MRMFIVGLVIGITLGIMTSVMAQSRPVEWIINKVYNSSTTDISVIEN